MKKILICILLCLCVSGCVIVNNSSIDEILTDSLNSELRFYNTTRNGYKYYLPKGLRTLGKTDYNEILADFKYKYYMYVDILSYNNKISFDYIKKSNVYYSNVIKYKDKFGYLEIKSFDNEKYLIEIMYNYAKIEVMVDKKNIKEAVAYSMSILTSIKYNDTVIKNKLDTHVLSSYEETVDIFKTATNKKSNYLKYVEDKTYDKDVIPDMDLVN